MSDPLDRLTEFGSSFEGGTMPKSAAEVRARGDQIRRRRQGLIAGAATAAVVAVAVPVVAVIGSPGGEPPEPAPNPTVSDTASVTPSDPITEANLMVPTDIPAPEGIVVGYGSARRGDGQPLASPCQPSSLEDLGATTVFQRDYFFSASEGGDGAADHHLNETIAQFPSAAAAREAAGVIRDWHEECDADSLGADDIDDKGVRQVEIPGVEASIWQGQYGPPSASPGSAYDARDDQRWHLESGTVVAGDRLAMVTDLDLGGRTAAEPWVLEGILPVAAERLLVTMDRTPGCPKRTCCPTTRRPTTSSARGTPPTPTPGMARTRSTRARNGR